MKTSARNEFRGAVLQVNHGAVNDEIVIVLDGSNARLVSTITSTSSKSLGLEPGKTVLAVFKAPWVILTNEQSGVRFSARNQLPGTVVAVTAGAVNAEARVRLDGGEVLTAIVTMESVKGLELEAGKRVVAMIKASHVIIGVEE